MAGDPSVPSWTFVYPTLALRLAPEPYRRRGATSKASRGCFRSGPDAVAYR